MKIKGKFYNLLVMKPKFLPDVLTEQVTAL